MNFVYNTQKIFFFYIEMHFSFLLRGNIVPTILFSLFVAILFLLFFDVSRSSEKILPRERIDAYVLCTS